MKNSKHLIKASVICLYSTLKFLFLILKIIDFKRFNQIELYIFNMPYFRFYQILFKRVVYRSKIKQYVFNYYDT